MGSSSGVNLAGKSLLGRLGSDGERVFIGARTANTLAVTRVTRRAPAAAEGA